MINFFKISLIAGILTFGVFVFAQPVNVSFPVPELGNCGSPDECKTYCDNPVNKDVCMEWAKSVGLIQDEPRARIEENVSGPGGCSSQQECSRYCESPNHANECLDFAVKEGFMSEEEAERIRTNMNREANMTGPGGCSSREECDSFCRNPENSATCLQFAVAEGMLTQEEADFLLQAEQRHRMRGSGGPGGPRGPGGPDIDEEKVKQMLSEGMVGPGGCVTMDECDVYCSVGGNDEECMNFAIEHGLIPSDQIEKFKKLMTMGGPGGCRGQQECDAYCDQPNHQDECMQFAIDNELMPPEEIEMMKKMKNMGGPGGCRGQKECDAFCSQPGNGEICFNFSKEHGLMPPEEIEMMEREMEIMKRMDRGDMGGPGGCKGREECEVFCQNPANMEECMNFAGDQGMKDRGEMDMRMQQYQQMESMMKGVQGSGGGGYGGPPSQGYGGGSGYSSGPSGPGVMLNRQSSGLFDFTVMDSDGVASFSFKAESGNPYGGSTGACNSEFKSSSSYFGKVQYPLTLVITDCNDEVTEIIVSSGQGYFGPSAGETGDGDGPSTSSGSIDSGFESFGSSNGYEEEFERQHEEEFQRQYEQQTQQGIVPSSGMMGQPENEMGIPEGYESFGPTLEEQQQMMEQEMMRQQQMMMEQQMQQQMQQQMPVNGGPTSALDLILGTILGPFLRLFQ